jgi:hypothetical protein
MSAVTLGSTLVALLGSEPVVADPVHTLATADPMVTTRIARGCGRPSGRSIGQHTASTRCGRWPTFVWRGTLAAVVRKFSMIALIAVAVLIWSGDASAESRHGTILLPPVSPACISSAFGPRVLPNRPQAGTYHNGVDLPAPEGAPVLATAPGTVIRIQNKGPGGLEMLVQHDGFVGIYSHFGMVMPAFAEGKRTVAAGEKLGVVGNTGITSGAHLYFEMDLAGKPIDPAPYLRVPQCNGEVHQAQHNRPDTDAKTVGTRKYFVLLPVGHPYQLPER